AVTPNGTFPLVRQFRPALEEFTLELPSGHVDLGESPEQAARKELREETGFVANELILLGSLSPDTGRLSNPLRNLILAEPAFSSALNRAPILMAVAGGHIKL